MLTAGEYVWQLFFLLGAHLVPLASTQCSLNLPDTVLTNKLIASLDTHREFNPNKFQRLDLAYLCYSRSVPDSSTVKDARISLLYSYERANFSVQATLICPGADRWRYISADNRIVGSKPEDHVLMNMTKEGCIDCLYDRSFAQPTWCRG